MNRFLVPKEPVIAPLSTRKNDGEGPGYILLRDRRIIVLLERSLEQRKRSGPVNPRLEVLEIRPARLTFVDLSTSSGEKKGKLKTDHVSQKRDKLLHVDHFEIYRGGSRMQKHPFSSNCSANSFDGVKESS
jgi:hypothetical protein